MTAMAERRRFRVAIDIGGTFTDLVLLDEATGATRIIKLPSTPSDPSIGFENTINRILQSGNVAPSELVHLVHGTTVATNAIIKDTVAKTGLITTRGFRDVLEIGRQVRPHLYDLTRDKPKPLVPRSLRLEVTERVDNLGRVLVPLDEDEAKTAVESLRKEDVSSIAVCFLHSYANSTHEAKVGAIIEKHFPAAFVSISSEICPEFREYERMSTVVLNASVMPIVSKYLEKLETRLESLGVGARLHIMQSSGGIMTSAAARKKTFQIIESGPASGVIAAAYLGKTTNRKNVISFDMGGTTAKAGLIENGAPKITTEYEVGSVAHSGHTFKGSGYPINAPMIDLVEIGAGGGSIAWVNEGGTLQVGPQSAEAEPGPACYGLGGTVPTITDANVILGRLNPNYLLDGEMRIHRDLSEKVIAERIATKLGTTVEGAAEGIVRIANANMMQAIRIVSIERGYDPRDFAMVAFGGAGPVHAAPIARDLGIPEVIIPTAPGAFSAFGMIGVDVRHDFVMTRLVKTLEADLEKLNRDYASLVEQALLAMKDEGFRPESVQLQLSADVRYVGQAYEVNVPVPRSQLTQGDIGLMNHEFHSRHHKIYGHSAESEPTEIVNLRATAVGLVPKPKTKRYALSSPSARRAKKFQRRVFFEEHGFVNCPVYGRSLLKAGNVIKGPAIVEQLDATTVAYPDQRVRVDRYLNLVLEES